MESGKSIDNLLRDEERNNELSHPWLLGSLSKAIIHLSLFGQFPFVVLFPLFQPNLLQSELSSPHSPIRNLLVLFLYNFTCF